MSKLDGFAHLVSKLDGFAHLVSKLDEFAHLVSKCKSLAHLVSKSDGIAYLISQHTRGPSQSLLIYLSVTQKRNFLRKRQSWTKVLVH